jgi:hypothetical protein
MASERGYVHVDSDRCAAIGHRSLVEYLATASIPTASSLAVPSLPFTKEKSRPGATPSGFLMRLPVPHCSGSVASIGKADAVWLTKDYRVCSDELMQAPKWNKSSHQDLT